VIPIHIGIDDWMEPSGFTVMLVAVNPINPRDEFAGSNRVYDPRSEGCFVCGGTGSGLGYHNPVSRALIGST